jgi:hypothetical protein
LKLFARGAALLEKAAHECRKKARVAAESLVFHGGPQGQRFAGSA